MVGRRGPGQNWTFARTAQWYRAFYAGATGAEMRALCVEQIRAYIKDPLAFRYGMMPGNPDLDERALDDLVAYLRAMAKRKHDPERRQP